MSNPDANGPVINFDLNELGEIIVERIAALRVALGRRPSPLDDVLDTELLRLRKAIKANDRAGRRDDDTLDEVLEALQSARTQLVSSLQAHRDNVTEQSLAELETEQQYEADVRAELIGRLQAYLDETPAWNRQRELESQFFAAFNVVFDPVLASAQWAALSQRQRDRLMKQAERLIASAEESDSKRQHQSA